MLVRLSLANFEYFGDTKPDGGDLRFIAGDDKTPLKYHVERYDPQAQMAFVWVQVPRLAGGAAGDKIYLYYGNKDAAAGERSRRHLRREPGAGVSLRPRRGRAAGLDCLQGGAVPPSRPGSTPAALIGAGAQFTGSTLITVPATGALLHDPTRATRSPRGCASTRRRRRAYVAALEDANGAIVLGLDGARVFAETSERRRRPRPCRRQAMASRSSEWHHVALTLGAGRLTLWSTARRRAARPRTVADDRR